ncbi:MAG: endonuclease NucS [Halobacteriales archaeon]
MTTSDADRSTAVRTVRHPDPETALDVVETGIDDGQLVTVFGRCTVEYDGRATSTLGPGDRHVMLKPDGTVLVHKREGQQPVNWQPPGCTHDPMVKDGVFRIHSRRTSPDEQLVVRFEEVIQVSAFVVSDANELSLAGTEEDLRERILEQPQLIEAGFSPLATERETPAGAVDIYGQDSDGNAVVVELKRRRVGPDAVGQLARYVDALDRDLHAEATVRGILVAPSVTDRARRLLDERGLEFVSVSPPDGEHGTNSTTTEDS